MYSEVVVILVCIPKVWVIALGHLSQRGHFGNFVSISAHLSPISAYFVSILPFGVHIVLFGVHFAEFLCPKCPYVSNFVSQLSDLCPKMSILCSGC